MCSLVQSVRLLDCKTVRHNRYGRNSSKYRRNKVASADVGGAGGRVEDSPRGVHIGSVQLRTTYFRRKQGTGNGSEARSTEGFLSRHKVAPNRSLADQQGKVHNFVCRYDSER